MGKEDDAMAAMLVRIFYLEIVYPWRDKLAYRYGGTMLGFVSVRPKNSNSNKLDGTTRLMPRDKKRSR
jgi:hypothetical protein